MKKIDGDSGTPVDELPAMTIGDQDDREYWNQPRVLMSTGKNLKVEKGGILEWFEESCKRYNVPKNAKVLIIGGGPGRLVKGMQQLLQPLTKDWEIIVAEGSAGMVENAKKNLADIHPDCKTTDLCKVDYRHLNAMDLEYEEEFDLIWTCTVTQHNSKKNKDLMYPRMYKALKHKGLYICLEGTKTEKHWVDPELPDFPEGRFKRYSEWGRYTFDWGDKKGCKGTASWWIREVGQHGFELIQYGFPHVDWFVFRKIREIGSVYND
ncbi:MAG: class I SAM-dependent methyltransferase [Halanaerobiales bacterium]|nr:class I SAM-dependent methyltransferase [Halanaerobiales bacterium]